MPVLSNIYTQKEPHYLLQLIVDEVSFTRSGGLFLMGVEPGPLAAFILCCYRSDSVTITTSNRQVAFPDREQPGAGISGGDNVTLGNEPSVCIFNQIFLNSTAIIKLER